MARECPTQRGGGYGGGRGGGFGGGGGGNCYKVRPLLKTPVCAGLSV